jgi:hypothetical protein
MGKKITMCSGFVGNLKKRDGMEGGQIITQVILKGRVGSIGMDSLVHYRNQNLAVLNMVLKLWVL